ncbi:hypothetical protein ACFWMJ_13480 [Streptomyces hawaiiensis]|uniref:hypothetical protein n=1 Tax=Streptomyces hawaiiensis TaxID=67305 RepID=UPI0036651464
MRQRFVLSEDSGCSVSFSPFGRADFSTFCGPLVPQNDLGVSYCVSNDEHTMIQNNAVAAEKEMRTARFGDSAAFWVIFMDVID